MRQNLTFLFHMLCIVFSHLLSSFCLQCHGHWHNKEQTYYELFAKEEDGTRTGVSVVGRKQAFCMVDSGVYPATTNATAFSNNREFMGCELFGEVGIQGISAGWFDNYSYDLPGKVDIAIHFFRACGVGLHFNKIGWVSTTIRHRCFLVTILIIFLLLYYFRLSSILL